MKRILSWPVAIDVGFAELKLASYAVTASGFPAREIKTLVEPSMLERGGKRLSTFGSGTRSGRQYRTVEPDGAEEFWTHRPASQYAEETRFPDYHTSPLNRALVGHGLVRAAETGVIPQHALETGVTVMTSVPVKQFLTADGAMNKEYLRRKRDWLTGGSVFFRGADEVQRQIRIDRHFVACQAIAAWFDYVSDESGEYIDSRAQQEIGVVDIGGETTDFTVMVPVGEGHVIDSNRSGSARTGVLLAVDELQQALSERLNESVPVALARELLNKGVVSVRGREVRAPELVRRVCSSLAARVMRDVGRHFRGLEGMIQTSRIIVVGGGAALLDQQMFKDEYPQAEFPPAPQFANARGMLRYMTAFETAGEYEAA